MLILDLDVPAAFHGRLAITLSNRIDKHEGTATVGQKWLARKIGATDRGVRKAIIQMETQGLLVTSRPATGRGNATIYRPIKLRLGSYP